MSDNLLLTRDGAVATLTMNRPDALNVLDLPMMDALVAHTAALASDSTLRVVVLRGAGKHFMAGGDLRTFATQLSQVPPELRQGEFQRIVDRLHPAIEHLQRMPHPVIAAMVLQMTELNRHRRPQTLESVAQRLRNYRDQATDYTVDYTRLKGFRESTPAGRVIKRTLAPLSGPSCFRCGGRPSNCRPRGARSSNRPR